MTSSTMNPNSPTNSHRSTATRLTNFSIDAIIGQHHQHHHQQQQGPTIDVKPVINGSAELIRGRADPCVLDICGTNPMALTRATNPLKSTLAPTSTPKSTEAAPTPPIDRHHQQPQQRGSLAGRKVRPKNFLCPSCKMAFSNNGQLRNHARIHTGERPFRCQYDNCNKSFTRNEELTRHKLIHTGFRPHSCNTCGKRFGRKDHLKKHLRTHENKRNRQLRKRALFIPSITTTTTTTTAASVTSATTATTVTTINQDGGDSVLALAQANPMDANHLIQMNQQLGIAPQPQMPSIQQLANEYYRWYSLIYQSNGQYSS